MVGCPLLEYRDCFSRRENAMKQELNLQQEKFCQMYVKNDECFNNATKSYAEAYEYDLDSLSKDDAVKEGNKIIEKSSYDKAYNVCSVGGHALLRKPKIQERIIELFNEVLTDEQVDAELAKVIRQGKELTPKINAIKVYNEVKGRVVKRQEITGKDGKDLNIFSTLSTEELRKLIEKAEKDEVS